MKPCYYFVTSSLEAVSLSVTNTITAQNLKITEVSWPLQEHQREMTLMARQIQKRSHMNPLTVTEAFTMGKETCDVMHVILLYLLGSHHILLYVFISKMPVNVEYPLFGLSGLTFSSQSLRNPNG